MQFGYAIKVEDRDKDQRMLVKEQLTTQWVKIIAQGVQVGGGFDVADAGKARVGQFFNCIPQYTVDMATDIDCCFFDAW